MLWLGTYDAKGGGGLYPLEEPGGAARLGAPEPRIANASFGLWSEASRTAYFVNEQDDGQVSAWRRQDGRWLEHGAVRSGGSAPCYLGIDNARRYLATANYEDGSVALIGLDESGAIRGLVDIAHHDGRGPDPDRQASAHVHCTLFEEDGSALYVVDLGLDRVFRYPISEGRLGAAEVAFEAPAGTGPRHLLLHPDRQHALLLSELSAELMLLARDEGRFNLIERIRLPADPADDDTLGGHLGFAPDGRIVTTVRGEDAVVVCRLEDGRLRIEGRRAAAGASPRQFVIHDEHAVVAHEEGGSVAAVPLPGAPTAAEWKLDRPGAAFVIDIPE